MKNPVYSVRDRHVGFMTPTVDFNDNTAKRNFAKAINSENGIMNFSAADFDLYHLGFFDTDSGKFEPLDIPELVVTGLSVCGVNASDR